MSRSSWPSIVIAAAALSACRDEPATGPIIPTAPAASVGTSVSAGDGTTPALVRQLAAGRGIVALPLAPPVRPALARLGQALFFDPLLSGNKNISCSTCHLPAFATGDAKSLSVGEGGTGLGPDRTHPTGVLIPRNAPAIFNLGAMQHLFWDGRVQRDAAGHLHTPAAGQLSADMARVLEFGPASALPMFPVTNRQEMRGTGGNELAVIPDEDLPGIWAGLMRRLGGVPEYRGLFEAAYPGTRFSEMSFAHAANAIGGFMVSRLASADSPWDRFLAGDDGALTVRQLEGARTFMTLKCSICHTGATFSDEQFHNVAVAQIGPGEGDGPSLRDDFGRMRVTGLTDDRYRFRTTPLRNVELTGPYGHDGAIASLRGFVEHYSESDVKLTSFDPMTLEPSLRGALLLNATDVLAQRDTLLKGVVLTPELVDKLVDYMRALTDDAARDLSRIAPARVPSGLPFKARPH
jgi:cytochrome c peroxidase